jgi:hypothetical protein
MDGSVQVDVEAYLCAMKDEVDRTLRRVMTAVNAAPDGAWVNASEMEVRDALGDLRQRAYEKAVQMRMDAAEGAFPPGGPRGWPEVGQQGA